MKHYYKRRYIVKSVLILFKNESNEFIDLLLSLAYIYLWNNLQNDCKLTSKFLILGTLTEELNGYALCSIRFNVRCEYLHVCLFVFIFGEFYVPFVKFSFIWIRHMMKSWLDFGIVLSKKLEHSKNWIMCVSKLILSSARRYRAYTTVDI